MSAVKHDFQQSTKGEVVKKQQKTQKKSQHVDDQLDGKKNEGGQKICHFGKIRFSTFKKSGRVSRFLCTGLQVAPMSPG